MLATLQLSSAHPPGRPVRKLSVVTPTAQKVPPKADKAPWIQQRWHHATRTVPYSLRVVLFHSIDTAPIFWAVLFRSLRGYPLLHANRTGLVHRTQLQTPSHKSLSLKRISLLALLEPSDLSVHAYLTPLQQPRDPVSPAAGPQSKTAQCVPLP